jgi:hypothetical protein
VAFQDVVVIWLEKGNDESRDFSSQSRLSNHDPVKRGFGHGFSSIKGDKRRVGFKGCTEKKSRWS